MAEEVKTEAKETAKAADVKEVSTKTEAVKSTVIKATATPKTKTIKKAIAKATEARISPKHSVVICKVLKGKSLQDAKTILEGMVIGKIDIDGRYYTNASKRMLEIIKTAEANASQKGMDSSRLFVSFVKSSKARNVMRPRSKAGLRGAYMRSTNVEIVLEER